MRHSRAEHLMGVTFAEWLTEAASRGEVVNTLFEERLFELVGILHRISGTLEAGRIPHEVIGGLAVLLHVEEANPEHATLTRDVDIMVRREDLDRVKQAAEQAGFRFRPTAGVDMLLFGPTESARNAVHLVFSGETVRPSQLIPNPPLAPEKKLVNGREVMVISLVDLLRMKLSAYRLKDQVHVKALDAAGLITTAVEAMLTPELAARLAKVRQAE